MPASDEEAGIRIELVFATTEKQTLLSVVVPEGCTAANAVTGSTLTKEFPNVDFSNCPIGVWGRPVSADYRLVPERVDHSATASLSLRPRVPDDRSEVRRGGQGAALLPGRG